jgi:phospholipase D1/2
MDGGSSGGRPYEFNAGHGGAYAQPAHQQYQQEASRIGGLGDGRWDSVSECYMLGGEDIRNVPWEGGAMNEIDAFVSEELYIHSKASSQVITIMFSSLTAFSFLLQMTRL